MNSNEAERVKRAYQLRKEKQWWKRYSWYQKGTLQSLQERERVLLYMLKNTVGNLSDKRILDVGCGRGTMLIQLLLYGAKTESCFGIDILEDRINEAKAKLPGMTFICCSAEDIPLEKGTFDLVTMFTCLSSVLDSDIRRKICEEAFAMLRPGGWFLIYDFRVSNPSNPDVRGVRLGELKAYFPGRKYHSKKLTLLPPLARFIGSYSMFMCSVLSVFPFLKMHRMTIFQKPLIRK
ncbi:MAG: class I SAM-dependent methyltransferase [Planctomycetota bacterium]|jgi:ubiquinone/menaquinone biosynthesis C-methylase UbiE